MLVNGLGATPLLELYVVYKEVSDALAARGVRIVRCLVGNDVTSLDMAGVSLTLCRADADMLACGHSTAHDKHHTARPALN